MATKKKTYCSVDHCRRLNLRKTPSVQGEVVDILPAGISVEVQSESFMADGKTVWMCVAVGAQTGWVDARYLTRED